MSRLPYLVFAIVTLILTISCGSSDDDDSGGDDDAAPVDDDTADDDATDDDADDDTGDDDTWPPLPDDDADDDTGDDDTTPLPDPPIEPGIYAVEGTDSRYGDYAGEVEIRAGDGKWDFIRSVRFDDVTFEDPIKDVTYDVYTAWLGEIREERGIVTDVSLKVADSITHYGAVTRTDDDAIPVIVTGAVTEAGAGAFDVSYATTGESVHTFTATETWTYDGASDTAPIFADEDTFIPGHNPMPGWLHALIYGLLDHYHSLSWFDGYRDREDFQAGVHYIARFHTDFGWYRAHPSSLRVANRWLDEVSMAETMLRARAYGPTLAEKAAMFDADMPTYYLNPLGMFSQAQWESDPLVQSESGDGLLWTGCYLASQVFRYLETGEEEALDNWLRALDGLFLSHDIPQDETTFARTVRPHQAGRGWVQGDAPYEDVDWLEGGNNDMIQGLYYGYTLSWIYLPDEPEFDDYRDGIALRAVRLADHADIALDGEFNEIKAAWLAYLTTGDDAYKTRYQTLYANPLLRFYTRMGGGMFYLWGVSDWSGQHLDTIGQLVLAFLAEATDDQDALAILEEGWTNGSVLQALTQTLFPISAFALGDPSPAADPALDTAIWNMRGLPYPKQSLAMDKHIDPSWSPSPLPSLFWKFDWLEGGRWQGLWGVPIWQRMHENLIITAPSDFEMGESDWMSGGGADFLHAYWLGRHFGVFGEDD